MIIQMTVEYNGNIHSGYRAKRENDSQYTTTLIMSFINSASSTLSHSFDVYLSYSVISDLFPLLMNYHQVLMPQLLTYHSHLIPSGMTIVIKQYTFLKKNNIITINPGLFFYSLITVKN